jgi:hypothetical protein
VAISPDSLIFFRVAIVAPDIFSSSQIVPTPHLCFLNPDFRIWVHLDSCKAGGISGQGCVEIANGGICFVARGKISVIQSYPLEAYFWLLR